MLGEKKYSAFPHVSHTHMKALQDCFSICASCSKMCINEGHKETAKLCGDCADICALTIKLHSGDSEFNEEMMDLCHKACIRCSEACEKMQIDHCHQCSEICKECADLCKKEHR